MKALKKAALRAEIIESDPAPNRRVFDRRVSSLTFTGTSAILTRIPLNLTDFLLE
jgi:hypothetical protein